MNRKDQDMKECTDKVLAYGEVTNHSHRATAKSARVFEDDIGHRTLVAPRGTKVVHEEHKPITIPPGEYDRTIVQEFDPFAEEVREVRD